MPGYRNLDDILTIEQTPLAVQPVPAHTLALLERGRDRNPAALALRFVFSGERPTESVDFTYAQLVQRCYQTANMLHELGVGATDVVSYLLPNLPETHFTLWGGQAAGIVNPLNPLLEPAQIAEILNAAGTKVLVTLRAFPKTDIWQKVQAVAPLVPTLRTVVTVDLLEYLPRMQRLLVGALRLTQPRPALPGIRVVDFAQASRRQRGNRLVSGRQIASADVACYFHTGGTTGTPKIAPLTHYNITSTTFAASQLLGGEAAPERLVFFCGLPLFHVNGVVVTGSVPWLLGHTVVLGSPAGYRGPGILDNFWQLVAHYRLSLFSGVPTIFSRLLTLPVEGHDMSSLRYAICGAAPLPVELLRAFEQRTGLRLVEGYGFTEGSCISVVGPLAGPPMPGSIGLRVPYQDVRIVILDEQTGDFLRFAEPEESGVLVVRGSNIFHGYLQPEHNKSIWVDTGDGQGPYYNTGDLGRMDAQGGFYITGRKKELIIRGGHNIDPKVIEDALMTHPAVALAAAIGSPDAHAGELPVAYVTLHPGQEATEGELRAFAEANIPERAAWPKQVYTATELPLTAIGKIFKPALTKQEISRVYHRHLAVVPELTVDSISVRDDKQRGLVAEISMSGTASDEAIAQALLGMAVPYDVQRAG
ncbi:acyl-CoA synthetase [Microvirga sp. STS02]|uniref:acyl-CoA synthetase n=1 Tax=Hymenobacter negativus TaxID=2795026 RepID=UPI0018DD5C9D|nr:MULTISPECIES: acyl-CoA synthetase [Bacteria]MBH8569184.1 acyl-CoA synthetase [Hymenobacter negativus]MBR7208919.1 acyl-CoA synthetase [Microvirga sp. STS02]